MVTFCVVEDFTDTSCPVSIFLKELCVWKPYQVGFFEYRMYYSEHQYFGDKGHQKEALEGP